MRFIYLITVCIVLAGCSSTPADLEAKATPVVRTYPENYQEIYRRVSSNAKRCYAGNVGAYSSFAVDSELYPDLGYGELTLSLINYGSRNYYLSVRVEKNGSSGAKLTARAGNTLAADRRIEEILNFASGGQDCPVM